MPVAFDTHALITRLTQGQMPLAQAEAASQPAPESATERHHPMKTWLLLLSSFMLMALVILVLYPAQTVSTPPARAAEDATLARHIATTEFCAKLVTYAEKLIEERKQGGTLPITVLQNASANLAHTGLLQHRAPQVASALIQAIESHPAGVIQESLWDVCHSAAL